MGVWLQWAYGTTVWPNDKSFTRRALDKHWDHYHIKSIVKPDAVVFCIRSHIFEVLGQTVDMGGNIIPEPESVFWTYPNYEYGQLNHYIVQSKADWLEKLARSYHDLERDPNEFDNLDRNEFEDLSALRYLAATESILAGV